MRPATALRPALVGVAAFALTGAGLVAAAPAAAQPHQETIYQLYTEWTVPDGVTSLGYEVSGGAGGVGGGPYPGTSDVDLVVTGTLAVSPGDVLEIWVGQQGSAGAADGAGGAGGAGFRAGGAGGAGGASSGGGGGGGGSSAIRIQGESDPFVIVGGHGGGGGSPAAQAPEQCAGGAGGWPGAQGGTANWMADCNTAIAPLGGAAGTDAFADGVDAGDVEDPATNALLAGAGGGGGGGGQPGEVPAGSDLSGGGGGGGGMVVAPPGADPHVVFTPTSGYVRLTWESSDLEEPAPEDPAAPTLPATGGSASAAVWVAGGLLALGVSAAVAAALRRRTS